jgi:hypothetical protein
MSGQETAYFVPKGQGQAGSFGGGGGRPVFNLIEDKRGALRAMDSYDGERLDVNLARRNSGAIRSYTNRPGR